MRERLFHSIVRAASPVCRRAGWANLSLSLSLSHTHTAAARYLGLCQGRPSQGPTLPGTLQTLPPGSQYTAQISK
ncbi:hypothetical protein LX36DRAFT_660156 [Colletotrichum falcatum]|nr:hypothetical protein LX36DRAFT_660156 [Colletotrichum falcatum]